MPKDTLYWFQIPTYVTKSNFRYSSNPFPQSGNSACFPGMEPSALVLDACTSLAGW